MVIEIGANKKCVPRMFNYHQYRTHSYHLLGKCVSVLTLLVLVIQGTCIAMRDYYLHNTPKFAMQYGIDLSTNHSILLAFVMPRIISISDHFSNQYLAQCENPYTKS